VPLDTIVILSLDIIVAMTTFAAPPKWTTTRHFSEWPSADLQYSSYFQKRDAAASKCLELDVPPLPPSRLLTPDDVPLAAEALAAQLAADNALIAAHRAFQVNNYNLFLLILDCVSQDIIDGLMKSATLKDGKKAWAAVSALAQGDIDTRIFNAVKIIFDVNPAKSITVGDLTKTNDAFIIASEFLAAQKEVFADRLQYIIYCNAVSKNDRSYGLTWSAMISASPELATTTSIMAHYRRYRQIPGSETLSLVTNPAPTANQAFTGSGQFRPAGRNPAGDPRRPARPMPDTTPLTARPGTLKMMCDACGSRRHLHKEECGITHPVCTLCGKTHATSVCWIARPDLQEDYYRRNPDYVRSPDSVR